jgi:acyl carrier protein
MCSERDVVVMIYEKLCALVAEQFTVSVDSISMDTCFVDDLGADSLDAVELTMAIEETFDVPEVDEETVVGFLTVGDVFRFISVNCD